MVDLLTGPRMLLSLTSGMALRLLEENPRILMLLRLLLPTGALGLLVILPVVI